MIAFNSFRMEAFLGYLSNTQRGEFPVIVKKTLKSTFLILTMVAAARASGQFQAYNCSASFATVWTGIVVSSRVVKSKITTRNRFIIQFPFALTEIAQQHNSSACLKMIYAYSILFQYRLKCMQGSTDFTIEGIKAGPYYSQEL